MTLTAMRPDLVCRRGVALARSPVLPVRFGGFEVFGVICGEVGL